MRMTWHEPGSKIFEAGLDQVVLFVDDFGTPWNGVTGIGETSPGGEPTATYLDGEKVRNRSGRTEYKATIEAFAYPDVFTECNGIGALGGGLFVDNQPRKKFAYSYRTKIGNDLQSLRYGYKTHLVYNALATPSGRTFQTDQQTVSPTKHSWGISTLPVFVEGKKSSAHFIVDSTKVTAAQLQAFEDVIYGTENTVSRLPSVSELVTIFQ